ncbi:MAG: CapA family protein [Patescibacteria group bacterium]
MPHDYHEREKRGKVFSSVLWSLFAVSFGILSGIFVSLGAKHYVAYYQVVGVEVLTALSDSDSFSDSSFSSSFSASIGAFRENGFPFDFAWLASFLQSKKEKENKEKVAISFSQKEIPKEEPKKITLLFVGDIMLDRGVKSSVQKNGKGDFGFLFENFLLPEFPEGFPDVLYGNLEGPLSDKGENVGSMYSFRMSPEALPTLVKAGFNVLGVANNHAGDWGREAFEDTLGRLTGIGILPVGGGENRESAEEVSVVKAGGMKVGFVGFSDVGPKWLEAKEESAGILLASEEEVRRVVGEASKKVDVLVVIFHFGEEYQKKVSDRQKLLAHMAVDAGALLVVGAHPHVVQEIEEYKNGLIAYSLGNFIFDQTFSSETMKGGMLEVHLQDRGVVSHTLHSVVIDTMFRPEISLKKFLPEDSKVLTE